MRIISKLLSMLDVDTTYQRLQGSALDVLMQQSVHDTDCDSPLLPPLLLARVGALSRGLDEARHRICRGFTGTAGYISSPAPHCHDAQRDSTQTARSAPLRPFSLSVVIPALNEEALIGLAISSAAETTRHRRPQIIVADGGSSDGTVQTARRHRSQVVSCPRGRGRQMNAGAARASGDMLLFLHADSQLPGGYDEAMRSAWRSATSRGPDAPPRWGCFESIQLGGGSGSLRGWLVRNGVRWRTRALGAPYGDQAIFVDRQTFRHVGGFRDWALLEDVDLTERLRRLSPPVIVPQPVVVSARRWDRLGLLQTFLLNQYILCAWKCGIPPDKLAEIYSPRSCK